MAQTLVSCSFSPVSLRRVSSHCGVSSTSFCDLQPSTITRGFSSSFKTGAPLALSHLSRSQRIYESRSTPICIRCERSTKNSNGLDVWLGRLAMIGFATGVIVEVTTGKGLLEITCDSVPNIRFFTLSYALARGMNHDSIPFAMSFGVNAPLPSVALGVTGLVGALTAFFIFQSSSQK